MSDTLTDARAEDQQPHNSRIPGLCFGFGSVVVGRVFSYWLPEPVAFGLAFFVLCLIDHWLFFRGTPPHWRWMRNRGFLAFVLLYAAGAVFSAAVFYLFLKL